MACEHHPTAAALVCARARHLVLWLRRAPRGETVILEYKVRVRVGVGVGVRVRVRLGVPLNNPYPYP